MVSAHAIAEVSAARTFVAEPVIARSPMLGRYVHHSQPRPQNVFHAIPLRATARPTGERVPRYRAEEGAGGASRRSQKARTDPKAFIALVPLCLVLGLHPRSAERLLPAPRQP